MQMDILALAFPDKTFDGIWSSGSLLHLTKEDAKVALREAARVLKRGGYLYLNLKEGEGEGVVRDARYAGEEKYYAFYSEGELRKMLSEQELAVLDVEIAKAEGYRTTRTIYMLARKPPVMP
jgi:ubiquinone/menaquinone biosynthesis C-methylase UbiE